MSAHKVLVRAEKYTYGIPAENLTATDTISIEVQGSTSMTSVPAAGAYRIYDLAGHNLDGGALPDVMAIQGNAFTLQINFTLNADVFHAGDWVEWGLDIFQQSGGADEAMCIEFSDKEYVTYLKSSNPPFEDYCVDNGDGTFTTKTVPVPVNPIPSPSCTQCNGTGVDLVFALDGSASIRKPEWQEVIKFAETIGLGLPAAKYHVAYSIIQVYLL
jgi:hypothetical protein